jgi:hypothetical protein
LPTISRRSVRPPLRDPGHPGTAPAAVGDGSVRAPKKRCWNEQPWLQMDEQQIICTVGTSCHTTTTVTGPCMESSYDVVVKLEPAMCWQFMLRCDWGRGKRWHGGAEHPAGCSWTGPNKRHTIPELLSLATCFP